MPAVPATIPVTTPVADTVATAGTPLLHTPPMTLWVRVVVALRHTDGMPEIGAGMALTVSGRVAVQPTPDEYEMVAVPGAMPPTKPVTALTVAMSGCELLHAPPGGVLAKADVGPAQMLLVPVTAPGGALTVTTAVTKQPAAVV